ncbi:putative membrane protein [Diaminobutyricimonas aerilata]|uniref:Putative membrane protein n=1 Tax=Diaminobutyricimonas aerilata TaxID=1162967 RepID=A0A2M9CJ98_9MICO|nr:vitamin K epoxide reductase family protein [Diaminobutyricimonas aerilata]PJJ71966.1 putative membrane protein [Diaminobutyricimonas aerilata]
MTRVDPPAPPYAFAVFLILAGIIGWTAAAVLMVERSVLLEDPDATLACDFSLLVQCGKNITSWQGSLFGFPNPVIGLVGFVAPVVMGTALLLRRRPARWVWSGFNLGVLGALVFVIWLIYQSIFELATLCPWCMVVWSVTIPLFWSVTLYNLKEGHLGGGPALRRFAEAAYSWVPAITVGSYLVVAIVAQVRLDVLSYL